MIAIADRHLLDFFAVVGGQAGGEFFAARRLELCRDLPVFLADEPVDLVLAVTDQTQRDRLYATGRTGTRQLAPQNRREVEADEIVERAAGQIGIDQRGIDIARIVHRLEDRLFGNGVEDDALDGLVLERLLFCQHLENVPGNGFPLAVGVSRENEGIGSLECVGDVLQPLFRSRIHVPGHGKIFVRQHRTVLCGEVTDVPERCQDLVAGAQIFVDCLGFGGGFDDDDVHHCSRFEKLHSPENWISGPT